MHIQYGGEIRDRIRVGGFDVYDETVERQFMAV